MLFDSLPRPSVRVAPGVGHVPGWVGVDKQKALVEEMRGIARECMRLRRWRWCARG